MVIQKKSLIGGLLMSGLMGITSLYAKQSNEPYQPAPLQPLSAFNAQHQVSKSGVTFYAHALSKEQTARLFNGRGKELNTRKRKKCNLVPVHVTIQNNSPQTLLLKKQNIDLKLKKDKEVIQRFASNSVFKILGIFFGGLALTFGVGVGCLLAPLLTMGIGIYGLIFGSYIAIPVTVAGIGGTIGGTTHYVVQQDKQKAPIIRDYYNKALPEQSIIKPYSALNRLMFVRKKDLKPFTITLEDQTPMKQNIISPPIKVSPHNES